MPGDATTHGHEPSQRDGQSPGQSPGQSLSMSAYFLVSLSSNNGQEVLAISGELDVATASELGEALRDASGAVVIDCATLDFIDAAGIGVLARTLRHVDSIRLINVQPMVRRVITIVGLDRILLDGDERQPSTPIEPASRAGGPGCPQTPAELSKAITHRPDTQRSDARLGCHERAARQVVQRGHGVL